jgi:hypothetical protein
VPQASRRYKMLVFRICQSPGQFSQAAAIGSLEPRYLANAVFKFPPLLTARTCRLLSHCFSSTKRFDRHLEGTILTGRLLEKRK